MGKKSIQGFIRQNNYYYQTAVHDASPQAEGKEMMAATMANQERSWQRGDSRSGGIFSPSNLTSRNGQLALRLPLRSQLPTPTQSQRPCDVEQQMGKLIDKVKISPAVDPGHEKSRQVHWVDGSARQSQPLRRTDAGQAESSFIGPCSPAAAAGWHSRQPTTGYEAGGTGDAISGLEQGSSGPTSNRPRTPAGSGGPEDSQANPKERGHASAAEEGVDPFDITIMSGRANLVGQDSDGRGHLVARIGQQPIDSGVVGKSQDQEPGGSSAAS